MKLCYICWSSLLIFALLGEGCKSPNSATTGSPYVTISPQNLHDVTFALDTFQARITNHDLAETYFSWDTGDSTFRPVYQEPAWNFEVLQAYSKPGTYTVKVNAYDLYSNNIIASAETQVFIDTAKSSVEIVPQFYSGILPMTTLGLQPFSLSAKTSIPDEDLYEFWDFGDGTSESYLSGKFAHTFPSPGSYTLKVDVYQRNGIYVGTDTAAISITWPDVSVDSIMQSARIETFLVVDSSYSIFSQTQKFLPLSAAVPFSGTNIVSSWVGTDFSTEYQTSTIDFLINGRLSTDGKFLTGVKVFAKDATDAIFTYQFGYSIDTMQVAAVTGDKVVYKAFRNKIKDNSTDLFFIAQQLLGIQGHFEIDNWFSFIKANSSAGGPELVPQAELVFSKE